MTKHLRPNSLILSGLLALALTGCQRDQLGTTGVQVDMLTDDARLYATSFMLTWLDERERLFDVRVPEQGTIDEVQAPAVSVFVALEPSRVGQRRILVRGYRDETNLVSWATARIATGPHVWLQLGVKMQPAATLPDKDGDTLPDPIDNCPTTFDPCSSGSPSPEVDASVPSEPDASSLPDLRIADVYVTPTTIDGGTPPR